MKGCEEIALFHASAQRKQPADPQTTLAVHPAAGLRARSGTLVIFLNPENLLTDVGTHTQCRRRVVGAGLSAPVIKNLQGATAHFSNFYHFSQHAPTSARATKLAFPSTRTHRRSWEVCWNICICKIIIHHRTRPCAKRPKLRRETYKVWLPKAKSCRCQSLS